MAFVHLFYPTVCKLVRALAGVNRDRFRRRCLQKRTVAFSLTTGIGLKSLERNQHQKNRSKTEETLSPFPPSSFEPYRRDATRFLRPSFSKRSRSGHDLPNRVLDQRSSVGDVSEGEGTDRESVSEKEKEERFELS